MAIGDKSLVELLYLCRDLNKSVAVLCLFVFVADYQV